MIEKAERLKHLIVGGFLGVGIFTSIDCYLQTLRSSNSAHAANQEDGRYAELVILHRSLQNEFPLVPDQVHYSFTSPICQGRWEGTAEKYQPPKVEFFFPKECDENIPLEGIITPHYPGCRPTTYRIYGKMDGTRDRQAELIVKTILQGPAQRSYAHINCEKIQD